MAGGKIQKKRHLPDQQASKGEHILKNPILAEYIVEKSRMKPTDVVLEIGSGTGNLTKKLLENAMSVIAIELDPSKVLELNRRFQDTPFASRLKIITGDVRKCDLPYFDICVANVPHQISSFLTIKLLCHRRFRCALIMVQREFAMRLVANPEDNLYCRLSANTQFLGRTLFITNMGHTDFRSVHRGDFFVVGIAPRKSPLPVKFKEWYGLIRLCFAWKDKTLGSLFREKRVLLLLEKRNYKTLQALQLSEKGQMEEDKVNDDVADLANMIDKLSMEFDVGKDDEEMDVDMVGGEGSAFKEKVLDVLRQCDFMEKISSKLTREDFLYLLSQFNKSGIHFS